MADAMDAGSNSSASGAALAGAQIHAECASGSRTLQLTRKRSYKTMDLQRHKSNLAMTPPGRPFFADNPKRGPQRELSRKSELSMSFGGGLAQIWAEASDPERRAWSSIEEFVLDRMRPCRPRAINALPLPARGFRGGRGRGEWGKLGAAERVTSLD